MTRRSAALSRQPPGARSALLLAMVVLAGSALVIQPASAEKTWGYDLAHELMSPFCPGRTLATCPSPQAAELVQWIVTQEAAGASRDEVVAVLVERYGEEILGAPPAEGITLWAYVFPVLGFLVGGVLAFVVLRRIVAGGRSDASGLVQTTPGAAVAHSSGSDDELARIVDAELAGRS